MWLICSSVSLNLHFWWTLHSEPEDGVTLSLERWCSHFYDSNVSEWTSVQPPDMQSLCYWRNAPSAGSPGLPPGFPASDPVEEKSSWNDRQVGGATSESFQSICFLQQCINAAGTKIHKWLINKPTRKERRRATAEIWRHVTKSPSVTNTITASETPEENTFLHFKHTPTHHLTHSSFVFSLMIILFEKILHRDRISFSPIITQTNKQAQQFQLQTKHLWIKQTPRSACAYPGCAPLNDSWNKCEQHVQRRLDLWQQLQIISILDIHLSCLCTFLAILMIGFI